MALGSWHVLWNGAGRDVRAEVFRDASLDLPVSILQADLVRKVAEAFALHPWVKEVLRVQKHHPASMTVDLVYRKPVCMVAVPGGLYAVDDEGVWLPRGDFSPVEAARYPRLVGVETAPHGPVGTPWGDARVLGAAQIAAAFGPAWQELALDQILPSPLVEIGHGDEFTYELSTRGGTAIYWGRAPGTDMPGEVPATDKVARLKKLMTEYESLDALGSIDLRGRERVQVTPKTNTTGSD
jgi:hypothetical protein